MPANVAEKPLLPLVCVLWRTQRRSTSRCGSHDIVEERPHERCPPRRNTGHGVRGGNSVFRSRLPGNHERAGKRLSGRTTKGSPWLRTLLGEAAHAAAQTKNTSFSAASQRIRARGGAKQAMIAVGHAILVICSHLLDRHVCSQELGGSSFDERDRQTTEKRLVRR